MSDRTAELGRKLAAARSEADRLLGELRQSVIADRKAGERATDIINNAGVALRTIYKWFAEADEDKD